MPYVNRDKDKQVVGIFARPQKKDQEFLKDDDQEIIDFLQKIEDAKKISSDNLTAERDKKIDSLFKNATTVAKLRTAIIEALKAGI